MKKFVFLLTLVFAIVSVARVFPCTPSSYIEEKAANAPKECSEITKCTLSSTHIFCHDFCEVLYDHKTFSTEVVLIPSLLGQIFFPHTNTQEKTYLTFFDRPPSTLS